MDLCLGLDFGGWGDGSGLYSALNWSLVNDGGGKDLGWHWSDGSWLGGGDNGDGSLWFDFFDSNRFDSGNW